MLPPPDGTTPRRAAAAGFCPLALAVHIQQSLEQRLRLACREVCGQRAKLRGLSGQQLLDVAREPDIERAEIPVERAARVLLAGAAEVFADIDSPIALAFLRRYPSPADAHALGEQRLARFLARHSYCGRKTPRELLDQLRARRARPRRQPETEARRQVVIALVSALESIVARISELIAAPRRARRPHRRRDLQIAVQGPQIRDRRRDNARRDRRLPRALPTKQALSADSGQAPVAAEIRQEHTRPLPLGMRPAASATRSAPSLTAAATGNPWANDIYQRARARGCTHPHAIRILGRAWCGVDLALLARPRHLRPRPATALQELLARTATT